jgi:Zn-dependent protease
LVHADELQRRSEEAKALEAKGELRAAGERWLECVPLLPRASKQADWIKEHIKELNRQADTAGIPQLEAPPPENKWGRKLAPLGPIAVLLAKSKALLTVVFKLNFLLSLVAFIGVYWALYGPQFGIGFALLILVHEMGHFIEIKRLGLPADMPVFLPGLGAYVRWRALGVSLETRAAVSLAGPLAGCIGSLVCVLVWWKTGNGLWAALARANAWLNVMNLIPIWVLDGGQAALALSRVERVVLLTGSLVLWAVLRENIFIILAVGAAWRVFTKDAPAKASPFTTAYFVGVLTALGLVMRFLPGPR